MFMLNFPITISKLQLAFRQAMAYGVSSGLPPQEAPSTVAKRHTFAPLTDGSGHTQTDRLEYPSRSRGRACTTDCSQP